MTGMKSKDSLHSPTPTEPEGELLSGRALTVVEPTSAFSPYPQQPLMRDIEQRFREKKVTDAIYSAAFMSDVARNYARDDILSHYRKSGQYGLSKKLMERLLKGEPLEGARYEERVTSFTDGTVFEFAIIFEPSIVKVSENDVEAVYRTTDTHTDIKLAKWSRL